MRWELGWLRIWVDVDRIIREYKINIIHFPFFRPEAIDLSFCDVNVYDEADTVVKVGKIALFHYHDQWGFSCFRILILMIESIYFFDNL